MSGKPYLNGSDYLMLGFDRESRTRGFAGNSCHIILELAGRLELESLQKRIDEVFANYPVLQAHVAGVFLPYWKLPRRLASAPRARIHQDEQGLIHRLVNESLDSAHGELVRFQLIKGYEGKDRLFFTWAHTFMDAISAELWAGRIGRCRSAARRKHSRQN